MNEYYTLIWKISSHPTFKSFVSFEELKFYVKNIINGKIKDLKCVDKEKTIYYLEVVVDEK